MNAERAIRNLLETVTELARMIRNIKNRIEVLRVDPHLREVAYGSFIAVVMKVVGSALSLLFNIIVARLLGAEGTGIYFLAVSVTAIGSVVGRVGLDNTLLRFTATYATQRKWGALKGNFYIGMRIALCAAGLLSLLGFTFAPWIAATLFDKPELGEPLRWMSLSILPNALLNLQAESLKGLKRIRSAMMTQGIGIPLVGLAMVWPLANAAGIEGVTWAYLIANLLTAVFGWQIWRQAVSDFDSEQPTFSYDEVWQSCKALYVQSVMNRAVLPWAPLLLLGIWSEAQEAGIFGAAVRVSMLVSLILMTANNVIAPKFAELYATDQIDVLGQTARRTALLITVLVSPIFLLMIFAGKWVMAMFGPEFEEGALALAILATGQFVNSITGSVNHLLIVTGNERIVRNTTVITALILTSFCLLLIPSMDAVGAAIAAASATIGNNLIASYMVWRKLGVVTIPFLRSKL